MRWVLRLVEMEAEGEARITDVMEIVRPDGLEDIAALGLTLAHPFKVWSLRKTRGGSS